MAIRSDHERLRVRDQRPPVAGLVLALGTGAVILGGAMMSNRRHRQLERARHYPDSAPLHARRAVRGRRALTGNSVIIARPRQELFAFWQDRTNLAGFMENVKAVRHVGDRRWDWTIAAPGGFSVDLHTEVVEEREGELIAWRTLPHSDVEAEGRVSFRDAPAGRGTIVEATIAYRPPAGELGRWIAKLFQREPNIQGRRELRRFKMLMETGEIATSKNRNSED